MIYNTNNKLNMNQNLLQTNDTLKNKFLKLDNRLNTHAYISKYHKKYLKKKESEILQTLKNKTKIYNPNVNFKKAPDLFFYKYSNLTYNKIKKHHLKLTNLNFQTKKDLNIYNFIKTKESLNTKNNTINIYIKKTKNNLFITFYTKNYIFTKTITTLGFKGRSKQSQFAYKLFTEFIIEYLTKFKTENPNFIYLDIYFCNHYNRRLKTLIQSLDSTFKIANIYNKTAIPFNGCRKRKISIRKKRKSIVKLLSY